MVREREREEEVSPNVGRPELGYAGDPYCHGNRNNKFILTAALHATHFAFVGLLIGLIQVKYQNRTDSPYETSSKLMTISVVALAFYGLAIAFKIIVVLDSTYYNQSSYLQSILTYVTTIFGGLSSVSLLSVLIKDRLSWLVYLIWVILISTAVYYSFKLISQFVLKSFFSAIFQAINMLIKHMFKNLMGFRSIVQQQHSNGTSTATTNV